LGDGGIDGDGFGGGADLEGHVDALLGADGNAEGFGLTGFEAAGFGNEAVFAQADSGKFETALFIVDVVSLKLVARASRRTWAPRRARPWRSRIVPRTVAESNCSRAGRARRLSTLSARKNR
jgi:hypothetical protein